jgi:chromosome segregation and condensation protein ScpB
LTELADANAIIDEAALEAGRDPVAIRRLANIGGHSGPAEQWAEQLAALTLEHGFTGYIAMADDPATIARFGQEVAPAVRELVAAERGSTAARS